MTQPRRLAHHLATFLMALISLFGIGALYYATLEPDWLRDLLALSFAGIAGTTLFLMPAPAGRYAWAGATTLLLLWYLHDPARNDRDWAPEYAIPATIGINGQTITINNIRNFAYRTETDPIPAYDDATFQLNQLATVDLVSSYWSNDTIAHIFLTFGFSDGRHIAISIETRRQRHFTYSTLAGFFHHYELFYVVADERDLIGVRTDIRHERVYLYRLQMSQAGKEALLLNYLTQVQKLDATPQWYNTVTDNCTTGILARARNIRSIPYNWRLLLSGYAPDYAYQAGLLEHTMPFAELRQKSLITRPPGAQITPDYSADIRRHLPLTPAP